MGRPAATGPFPEWRAVIPGYMRVCTVLFCAVLAACAAETAGVTGPAEAEAPATDDPAADSEPDNETAAASETDDSRPASLEPVIRPEEQLLILELRLRNLVASDGMFAYLDEGGLLLPLREFVRALEFPIGVDPANGRADGWFLSEDRLFALDIANRQVVIEGRKQTFDGQLVEIHTEDIYVDTRLLSRWFPVDVEFDLANLLVVVRGREPLLAEQRLERERRQGAAVARRGRYEAEYETVDVPYQWANWPLVNVSSQAGFQRDSLGQNSLTSQYNLLATADLVKMDSSLFVAGDEGQGVTQVRFAMGRKDPNGELLGPLDVTSYTFGDIATPSVALIANSTFGRGAQISSFPLQRTGEFDSTTLIGELPLGWEVELYRNEVLLDFSSSRADGRYEFVDIPLLFGVNVLRLAFFGPQGQRREEVSRVLVGPSQVPPGEIHFRVAANQHEEYLIPVPETAATASSDLQGEARAMAEFEYGVNKSFSLAGGVTTIPLTGGRRTYANVGARLGYGPVFSRLDLVGENTGGMAGKVGMQINLPLNWTIIAEHGEFRDFVSEDFEDDGDLAVRLSKLRLNGVVPGGSYFRLPFGFSASREQSESGATETRLGNRISLSVSRLSLSNSINWTQVDGTAADYTDANGSFLMAGRIGRTSVRGNLAYEIEPLNELSSAALLADHLIGADFTAGAGVERRFSTNQGTTVTGNVSRRFDLAALGLRGEWTNDGSWGAFMTLSFAFGREPRTGDWRMSSRQMADKGSVSARVFLDNDYDGNFGEGDTALEGVTFRGYGASGKKTTDADGVAFLTGLPPYRETDIVVPPQGLEDPYWVVDPEGVTLVPRSGNTATVDFPVVVTGEVDGMVYLREAGNVVEAADVALQLVDSGGKVVARTKSVFDGFYLFSFVRPGDYSVRVDPAQLERLGLASTGARKAKIEGDGTIVSGIAFTLSRKFGG